MSRSGTPKGWDAFIKEIRRKVDPGELRMALEAIQEDAVTRRLFERGVRRRDGTVKREETESELSAYLDMWEFSSGCVDVARRMCQNTTHPFNKATRSALEEWARSGDA